MNYRTMSFYKEFSCIGGVCEDSCCENWEIDLDEESVKLYKKQTGAFGKRLKDNMRTKEKQFVLKGTRCPFLNDENLCDIYTEMGENCLCQTCTNFPRHVEEFPELKEVSLTISCPEACRIMLRYKEPITFECQKGTDDRYGLKPMKPVSFWKKRKENRINLRLYESLFNLRKVFFEILQDRKLSLWERAALMMGSMTVIQEYIDQKQYDKIDQYIKNNQNFYHEKKLYVKCSQSLELVSVTKLGDKGRLSRKDFMLQLLNMYDGLENIKPWWKENLSEAMQYLYEMPVDDYEAGRKEFASYMREREYEFEHILVYYMFNYFLGASYDEDALTKVKFAVMSFLVIFELDWITWSRNQKSFTYENQVENAHAYSKEVEHSYNNYEALQLILSAHPLLNEENILSALMEF